jgi:Flp pilus assembly protein TadD
MMETMGDGSGKGVASYRAVLTRLALVAAALVVVGLLVASRHGYDECQTARRDVLATANGSLPASQQAAAIQGVRAHCRGTDQLVNVAGLLFTQKKTEAAMKVAQEAVDEEPENALAWRALAATAARIDPATARRAARRQLQLSPLDPPPVDPDGGP